ncbi:glycerate kinase [Candidatus Bathyarchaeota archaeon]|nr:glycerate kinase [Candidatus Bathyarchaeota archaeon]MBS7613133.1 glycerate kinase [Candidatus Bathyarchaeota archaeon]MBS7618598.1 glycerate kinase [Candidatus Bathyarchaeota archaeon]
MGIIKNFEGLISNGLTDGDKRARAICLNVLKRTLEEINPINMIKSSVKRNGSILNIGSLTLNLDDFKRIYLVGFGKASHLMALAIEQLIGDRISRGFINVLKGVEFKSLTGRVEFIEASHPIPDFSGQRGAEEIMRIVSEASEHDLVICLISGGGSAMTPMPADGISLEEKQQVTQLLLKSGANINEFNAVRKHISAFKGGLLAKYAYPARVLSLIISDVVGDRLDVISSGPTSPDTSTFQDVYHVLIKYNLWGRIPESVRRRIEAGLKGEVEETPKPGDKIFEKVHNFIVGSNRLACKIAVKTANELGLNSAILSSVVEGEARHVGTVYGGILVEEALENNPIDKPATIIAGGETTVTVKGSGIGGRNQELILSASMKIQGLENVAIASIGTDGVDGLTDAAGAIADGKTVQRTIEANLDPKEYLDNNDSYRFFKKLGDLIFTGPTGVNLMDITIMVALK